MAPALALLLSAQTLWAAETVVVLGAEGRAYREALEGFREAFGDPFEERRPAEAAALPLEARVVVAFGGRAAAVRYPADVALVCALTPRPEIVSHAGRLALVAMHPSAAALRQALAALGARRVGILWWSAGFAQYIKELEREEGPPEIVALRVARQDSLADSLRSLHGRVDALWLPADPALAAPGVLETIRASASYWNLPLYYAVPVASADPKSVVGPSFRAVGRAAAEAARDALEGRLKAGYRPALEAGP